MIYLAVRNGIGIPCEGLLLAVGKDRLRIILRGGRDVVELSRSYDQWLDESGDVIEIDEMVSNCSESIFADLLAIASAGKAGAAG